MSREGTVVISSGSTTDRTGKVLSYPNPIFSLESSLVITVHGSASVPVPAVVVIATTGRGSQITDMPFPEPPSM